MMKQYGIPTNTFYVSDDPYGKNSSCSSMVEKEFLLHVKKGAQLGKDCFSKKVITHQKVRHLVVDGYIAETKCVIEFFGCFIHFHRGCTTTNIG